MDYEKFRKRRNEENHFARENGITITHLSKGSAVVETDVDQTKLNPMGTVHGGCLFTMADVCAGSAASTHGHWVTTVNADINYVHPGKDVRHLTARSSEVKSGKTIIVNNVDIYDEKETLLVHGTFTFMALEQTF